LGSLKAKKAPYIVNKLPFNFMHVGLILKIFPKAQFLHCQRDWRDTSLSCFFQNFTDNHPWSNDFDNIKHYYASYTKLMEYWVETYPTHILTVEYEKIVKAFEPQCRRLIKFTNLQWEEECLLFYSNKSAVQSATKWQVRQPLHSNSIGRWQRYQSLIEQF